MAVTAGFAARHARIERKIAALSSPPTRLFSKENATLRPKGGRRRVVLIGEFEHRAMADGAAERALAICESRRHGERSVR